MQTEYKRYLDTATAWFGALCFFLSTIEYMIPKPLPFLRVGLANLPVMLALDVLPAPAFVALVAIKVLGQGLVGGTLFSYIFVFSAAGSIASAALMWALKKAFRGGISWIGIGVAGAFASNAAQLTLARFWIFGESAWFIAPPFLAVGVVTGALLGAFANRFADNSAWYADVRAGTFQPAGETATAGDPGTKRERLVRAIRLVVGITLIGTLLFSPSLLVKGAVTAVGLALVLSDGSRLHAIPALVMGASIVAFNLLTPFGKVLAAPLGFTLTDGALRSGIEKALTVEGMIFVSRWMLRYGIRLPGRAGTLVAGAFSALGRLTGGKGRIDPKNLVASIDNVMYGRDQGPR